MFSLQDRKSNKNDKMIKYTSIEQQIENKFKQIHEHFIKKFDQDNKLAIPFITYQKKQHLTHKVTAQKQQQQQYQQNSLLYFQEIEENQNIIEDNQYKITNTDKQPQNVVQKVFISQLQRQQMRLKNESKKIKKKRSMVNREFMTKAKIFFQQYNRAVREGTQKEVSLSKFARQNDKGYTTISKLYKKWLEDPTFTKQLQQMKRKSTIKRKKIKNTISIVRQQTASRILTGNPFLKLAQIAKIMSQYPECLKRKMNKQDTERVHEQTVGRLFTNFNYLRLRVKLISTKRNYPEDLKRRKIYCQIMSNTLMTFTKIYFIDQMVINKWITRDKVWAKRGTSFSNVMVNLRDDSFILLALMGSSGIPTYQTIHGKLVSFKYREIVDKLLQKPTMKYPDNPRMLVIHTAIDSQAKEIIKNVAVEKGYQLLFIPPFSQKLNPLAQWFIQIKYCLKRQIIENQEQLVEAMKKTFKNDSINPKNLPNFFEVVQKYIQCGINGQNF